MTLWHQFWFPRDDAPPATTPIRDAALWTPQALVEGQREMWQQAAQATEQWFGLWRTALPSMPLQPPAGVVLPPAAEEAPAPVAKARPARPATPRKAAVAAKPAARAAAKPRHAARGK